MQKQQVSVLLLSDESRKEKPVSVSSSRSSRNTRFAHLAKTAALTVAAVVLAVVLFQNIGGDRLQIPSLNASANVNLSSKAALAVQDWLTCSLGVDSCSSAGFKCCVANADLASGKATCRSSDCASNQPVNTKTAPAPTNVLTPFSDWNNCNSAVNYCASTGFVWFVINNHSCVAPADVASGKSTCRINSDCAIVNTIAPSVTVSRVTSTPNAVPTNSLSTISDWETCTLGASICTSGAFVCCVAPSDFSSGKATCRASNDCAQSTAPLPYYPPTIDYSKSQSPISQCVNANDWAMTFDDGPSTNIPSVLQILKSKGAIGTFFVNGHNYADLVNSPTSIQYLRDIDSAGHQIGTHTFEHVDLTTQSIQGIWDQMRLNDEAIRNILGKRPIHFRLPYLSTNDQVNAAIGSWGYRIVGVNVDTNDWRYSTLGLGDAFTATQQSYYAALSLNPSSAISLDHDFTNQITTWLPWMIDDIRARGFNLVTARQCLGDPSAYRP